MINHHNNNITKRTAKWSVVNIFWHAYTSGEITNNLSNLNSNLQNFNIPIFLQPHQISRLAPLYESVYPTLAELADMSDPRILNI
jgi:hypothetical protein